MGLKVVLIDIVCVISVVTPVAFDVTPGTPGVTPATVVLYVSSDVGLQEVQFQICIDQ